MDDEMTEEVQKEETTETATAEAASEHAATETATAEAASEPAAAAKATEATAPAEAASEQAAAKDEQVPVEDAWHAPEELFGYRFKDPELLATALTTPAYRMMFPDAKDNQRLEFLGDAVLGLLAADDLYRESPESAEGDLTVRRTHMVSTAPLCAAAQRLELAPLLRRNRGAKPLKPDSHALADAVEAIMGAAWLDGGFEAARTVYNTLALEANAESGKWSANPKGELQKRAQTLRPKSYPRYTTLSVGGSSHEPLFTVRVEVKAVGWADASARSRKEAESKAAANLLSVWPRENDEL